jgi:hypothetical protein
MNTLISLCFELVLTSVKSSDLLIPILLMLMQNYILLLYQYVLSCNVFLWC